MYYSSNYLLLIDDSAADIHLLQEIFKIKAFPANVEVCNEGQSAWNYLAGVGKNLPRLIILDLRLPDMNGIQLIRMLRSHPTFCQIPIVIYSGIEDPVQIKRSMKVGASYFIPKSYELESLMGQISKLAMMWEKTRLVN